MFRLQKDLGLWAQADTADFITRRVYIDCARAELMLSTAGKNRNEQLFGELFLKRAEIERTFGGELDWQELPDRKACRICVTFHDYGLVDEEHWDEVIDFLADNLAGLITTFKPLLDATI